MIELTKYGQADQFFQMPQESKEGIANVAGPAPQRGWSHLGAESSSSLYSKLIKGKTSTGLSDSRVSTRLKRDKKPY